MPGARSRKRAIVVGAGVGGLVAAIDLPAGGLTVDLCERAAAPGRKSREVASGEARLDAGPTVFIVRCCPSVSTTRGCASGSVLSALGRPDPAACPRAALHNHESLSLDRFASG